MNFLPDYSTTIAFFRGILLGAVLLLGLETYIIYVVSKLFTKKSIPETQDSINSDSNQVQIKDTDGLGATTAHDGDDNASINDIDLNQLKQQDDYVKTSDKNINSIMITASTTTTTTTNNNTTPVQSKKEGITEEKKQSFTTSNNTSTSSHSPKFSNEWPSEVVEYLISALTPAAESSPHGIDDHHNQHHHHPAESESRKWFNVCFHRYFLELRKSDIFTNKTKKKLRDKLWSKIEGSNFVSNIEITNLSLGDIPPTILAVRLVPGITDDLAVIIEMDVKYKGGLNITIETTIYTPLSSGLIIPVKVTLTGLAGRLRIRVPSPKHADHFGAAFAEDPGATFHVETIMSQRELPFGFSGIRDKLNAILAKKCQTVFKEVWVSPAWRTFFMPMMAPLVITYLSTTTTPSSTTVSTSSNQNQNSISMSTEAVISSSTTTLDSSSKKPMSTKAALVSFAASGVSAVSRNINTVVKRSTGGVDALSEIAWPTSILIHEKDVDGLEVPLVTGFLQLARENDVFEGDPEKIYPPVTEEETTSASISGGNPPLRLASHSTITQIWKTIKYKAGVKIQKRKIALHGTGEVTRGIIHIRCDADRIFQVLSKHDYYQHVDETFISSSVLCQYTLQHRVKSMSWKFGRRDHTLIAFEVQKALSSSLKDKNLNQQGAKSTGSNLDNTGGNFNSMGKNSLIDEVDTNQNNEIINQGVREKERTSIQDQNNPIISTKPVNSYILVMRSVQGIVDEREGFVLKDEKGAIQEGKVNESTELPSDVNTYGTNRSETPSPQLLTMGDDSLPLNLNSSSISANSQSQLNQESRNNPPPLPNRRLSASTTISIPSSTSSTSIISGPESSSITSVSTTSLTAASRTSAPSHPMPTPTIYLHGYLIEPHEFDHDFSTVTLVTQMSDSASKLEATYAGCVRIKAFIEELANIGSTTKPPQSPKKRAPVPNSNLNSSSELATLTASNSMASLTTSTTTSGDGSQRMDKFKNYIGNTASYLMKNKKISGWLGSTISAQEKAISSLEKTSSVKTAPVKEISDKDSVVKETDKNKSVETDEKDNQNPDSVSTDNNAIVRKISEGSTIPEVTDAAAISTASHQKDHTISSSSLQNYGSQNLEKLENFEMTTGLTAAKKSPKISLSKMKDETSEDSESSDGNVDINISSSTGNNKVVVIQGNSSILNHDSDLSTQQFIEQVINPREILRIELPFSGPDGNNVDLLWEFKSLRDQPIQFGFNFKPDQWSRSDEISYSFLNSFHESISKSTERIILPMTPQISSSLGSKGCFVVSSFPKGIFSLILSNASARKTPKAVFWKAAFRYSQTSIPNAISERSSSVRFLNGNVEVRSRNSYQVPFIYDPSISSRTTYLTWEFATGGYDIGFGVLFYPNHSWTSSNESARMSTKSLPSFKEIENEKRSQSPLTSIGLKEQQSTIVQESIQHQENLGGNQVSEIVRKESNANREYLVPVLSTSGSLVNNQISPSSNSNASTSNTVSIPSEILPADTHSSSSTRKLSSSSVIRPSLTDRLHSITSGSGGIGSNLSSVVNNNYVSSSSHSASTTTSLLTTTVSSSTSIPTPPSVSASIVTSVPTSSLSLSSHQGDITTPSALKSSNKYEIRIPVMKCNSNKSTISGSLPITNQFGVYVFVWDNGYSLVTSKYINYKVGIVQ